MSRARRSQFEGSNILYPRTTLQSVFLGAYSYVAADSHIQFASIGRYCSIGPACRIGLGRHPSRGFISTHPAFFSVLQQAGTSFVSENAYEEFKEVRIGNDVWIGAGVIIADGISIGDGAIIAAGAVVVTNVLPYHVVAGVPARSIRVRYSDEEVALLVRFAWWNRSEEWLRENVAMFADAEKFFSFLRHTLPPFGGVEGDEG